jgi:hypothetical protein
MAVTSIACTTAMTVSLWCDGDQACRPALEASWESSEETSPPLVVTLTEVFL